jgi:hypothetical protein
MVHRLLDWSNQKEVMVMRVTRKIQSLAEAKIRHAIVTGSLPRIVQTSTTEVSQKTEPNKPDSSESGQAK